MLDEDSTKWFKPVFEFHKADTFRKLIPMLLLLAVFTAAIAWLELTYLHLADNHPLKNITLMHGLLGFAISMLLVFRTNTAYERWWEGRKLWGSLVNCSRNLAIKFDAFLPDEARGERREVAHLVGAFAVELSDHLLNCQKPTDPSEGIDRSKHVPAQLAGRLVQRVSAWRQEGKLSDTQLWMLNGDLTNLMDVCGACERIKNTPIPYSYITFLKKFIVAYSVTLPMGYAFALNWLAVPVVVFVFYVLASLELIAEQIEDPFGEDSNDLPTGRYAAMITSNVQDLLVLRADRSKE